MSTEQKNKNKYLKPVVQTDQAFEKRILGTCTVNSASTTLGCCSDPNPGN